MLGSSSLSCGSFVILAFQEEKCDPGPGAAIKAILTTELIPDWLARRLASVILPLREKAIPFKDFPAHYFPSFLSHLCIFFNGKIRPQA